MYILKVACKPFQCLVLSQFVQRAGWVGSTEGHLEE